MYKWDYRGRKQDREAQLESRAGFQQHIAQVRKVLTRAASNTQNGIINTTFVSQYIDKIFVTPQEDGMRLEIKIFTGESTERFLENLRSRSGHTFLNMCSERTINFIRKSRIMEGHEIDITYIVMVVEKD